MDPYARIAQALRTRPAPERPIRAYAALGYSFTAGTGCDGLDCLHKIARLGHGSGVACCLGQVDQRPDARERLVRRLTGIEDPSELLVRVLVLSCRQKRATANALNERQQRMRPVGKKGLFALGDDPVGAVRVSPRGGNRCLRQSCDDDPANLRRLAGEDCGLGGAGCSRVPFPELEGSPGMRHKCLRKQAQPSLRPRSTRCRVQEVDSDVVCPDRCACHSELE